MSRRRPFAEGTQVPVSRTLEQIERLMDRFGGTDFMQASKSGQYQCWWKIGDRVFTAQIDYSDADDREARRRWRVIHEHIKSQLIAVDEGLLDPKVALMPFLMLPDGSMAASRLAIEVQALQGPDLPALMAPGERRGTE